jgi:hypothetical protein
MAARRNRARWRGNSLAGRRIHLLQSKSSISRAIAQPPHRKTMSETSPASAPPSVAAPAPTTLNQRIAKWVPILAGLVAAIVGGAKILENFTLPSCDSSRSLDTIKSIFKDKNLPEPTLTAAKGLTSASAEKTCQASYEIPNEKGTLDYKVFWEGWNVKVMITKVNT